MSNSILATNKERLSRIFVAFTRSKFTFVLSILISISLMSWLLLRIDLVKVVNRWQNVNWSLLALLITLLFLLNSAIRAGRVQLILRAQNINFPYRWLWLLQLRGTFILSFIPGKVSGDLYRGYAIGRDADRPFDSMTAVLLERVIGLGALVFVSVGSLLLSVYALGLTTYHNILMPVLIMALALLIATILGFIIIRGQFISRWKLPLPFWNRVQQLSAQLYHLFINSRVIATLALLSVFLQISIILWYFVAVRAMQLDISLLTLMVSVPVVELLVTVPISIGGIGVRESAMVFLLLPFGIAPEDAISLSLLVAITATIAGTLAGLSFFVALPKQISSQQPRLEQLADQPERRRGWESVH